MATTIEAVEVEKQLVVSDLAQETFGGGHRRGGRCGQRGASDKYRSCCRATLVRHHHSGLGEAGGPSGNPIAPCDGAFRERKNALIEEAVSG